MRACGQAATGTLALSLILSAGLSIPADAATVTSDDTIVSVRSFPKQSAVHRDLLAESADTDVDTDTDWGGIESLDVPQTKSQAEKDAEATAKAEAERQQQEAQAQAQTQAQAQQQTGEASRSGERTESSTITASASKTGQAVAEYAMQYSGYPYVYGGNQPSGWDCSGFVQYVYAQFGVSLPRTSGSQMTVGSPVGSLAEAQPGDIIANGQHAAIYVGNGMVMNAMSPSQGTGLASVSNAFSSAYAIRRVI
ncbi:C40 family peptidase [Bifidobacterium moukalabense]|uniref:Peptidase P60 n=1 Tax=Bifidobacterium moukalabense DSM 27321 TaxID=1435051 RepID=W4N8L9_9BIFI|nr:C40 family peptidase [Bifidobacterium moukalabense]ETY71397.1 peptidase P60 [Bifidobacterium moukalabense DSM 27321]